MSMNLAPAFSLLIKPAGADCNLRCEYCFYCDRGALYPEVPQHRMSVETLAALISKYMATPQPQYIFGWQGGEPTLMGLEFFQQATALQKRCGRSGAVVGNGLQTNGILIDDALAAHFAAYNFLLGVSLDGPADIHDRYRRNRGGEPTHALVRRGIERLQRHQVEFNILVLVSAANVKRGREVYRYLVNEGFFYHQYIPCVEFDSQGRLQPYAIAGEEWGEFLCAIYDEWRQADTRRVSIRLFDSILGYLVDGARHVCTMGRDCRQYLVVEHNGDVYPCDFFVYADWKLGNVMNAPLHTFFETEKYKQFAYQKAKVPACRGCSWRSTCHGGCQKYRLVSGTRDTP
ncbi:MAG: anaerobic sulfatase maturase, partial [Planctomycetota bacterium]|nr:anaerobic sulfatase maturase [Planctomycetota bacterium]